MEVAFNHSLLISDEKRVEPGSIVFDAAASTGECLKLVLTTELEMSYHGTTSRAVHRCFSVCRWSLILCGTTFYSVAHGQNHHHHRKMTMSNEIDDDEDVLVYDDRDRFVGFEPGNIIVRLNKIHLLFSVKKPFHDPTSGSWSRSIALTQRWLSHWRGSETLCEWSSKVSGEDYFSLHQCESIVK